MKIWRSVLFVLLTTLLCTGAPVPARAQEEEASFDYFYENLKPFGEWVEVATYGLCWHPTDVAEDWAPYTDGYWAYTDAGWTWVSYEDFGGIVYHYGRWVRVRDEGWYWVPDNDWGPAWVSWRNNEDYVGWAPLPPEAHFNSEVGISTWVDDAYDIGPDNYRFCDVRDFGAPVIREVCLPRSRNAVIIAETVNITNITINTGYGGPFCGGPRYDFFEGRVRRPIPTLKLVRERNFRDFHQLNISFGGGDRPGVRSWQRGNTLVMPAPRIRPVADVRVAFPNIRPTRVLAAANVSHGWESVKAPAEREQLRDRVREQNKGATPQSRPARAMDPGELRAVPQKADPNAPSPMANRGGRGERGGDRAALPPVAVPGGQPPAVTSGTGISSGANPPGTVVPGKGRKGGKLTPPGINPPAVPPNSTAAVDPANPAGSPAGTSSPLGRGKKGGMAPGGIDRGVSPQVIPGSPTSPGSSGADGGAPKIAPRGVRPDGRPAPGAAAEGAANRPDRPVGQPFRNPGASANGEADGALPPNVGRRAGGPASQPQPPVRTEDPEVRRQRLEALREEQGANPGRPGAPTRPQVSPGAQQPARDQSAAADARERAAAAAEARQRSAASGAAAQARQAAEANAGAAQARQQAAAQAQARQAAEANANAGRAHQQAAAQAQAQQAAQANAQANAARAQQQQQAQARQAAQAAQAGANAARAQQQAQQQAQARAAQAAAAQRGAPPQRPPGAAQPAAAPEDPHKKKDKDKKE